MSNNRWVAPLMGVIFVGLMVAAFILTGDANDKANATNKTAAQVVSYYKDHKDAQMVASFLFGLAAVFLLFFVSWIRDLLRTDDGSGRILRTAALGGGIVLAAGLGVAATIHLALVDTVDDIDPVAVQAVNAIDYDFFLPMVAGLITLLMATSIAVIRSGVLPKWLGWVGIVIAIASFTPIGFYLFLVGLLWILVVSIIGVARGRGAAATA
jgi:hypothetical protein